MNQALLSAIEEKTIFTIILVILCGLIVLLVLFSVWANSRQRQSTDKIWQEVAEHFQFRFIPENSSKRAIEGEWEGSSIHLSMEYRSAHDGSGGDHFMIYRIKPRNIDNILLGGRRDLDHHVVNQKLNSESITEILGRDQKTASCTLRYVDGWMEWTQTFFHWSFSLTFFGGQELLAQRIQQMLDITSLFLETPDSP